MFSSNEINSNSVVMIEKYSLNFNETKYLLNCKTYSLAQKVFLAVRIIFTAIGEAARYAVLGAANIGISGINSARAFFGARNIKEIPGELFYIPPKNPNQPLSTIQEETSADCSPASTINKEDALAIVSSAEMNPQIVNNIPAVNEIPNPFAHIIAADAVSIGSSDHGSETSEDNPEAYLDALSGGSNDDISEVDEEEVIEQPTTIKQRWAFMKNALLRK